MVPDLAGALTASPARAIVHRAIAPPDAQEIRAAASVADRSATLRRRRRPPGVPFWHTLRSPRMSLLPSIRGLPRAYWYLWTGALVNRLGGFIVPFLALYLTRERHLSVAEAGGVVSLCGVGSFASAPVGGLLADRIGRRRSLLLSCVLGAASMLHLGVARAPSHIAAAALLVGFCSDLARPSVGAMIADLVPAADRARAYGLLYWAINLGFALAMVIAGAVATRSFTALFVGDAATTLALAAIVRARVPETRPAAGGEAPRARTDYTAPYRDGTFLLFVALNFGVAVMFVQSIVALPLYLSARGISTASLGGLMAINGVLIVLLQPLAVGAVERFRRSHVLATGTLLIGAGFGLTALARGAPLYALTIAIWTAGEIVLSPVAPAVVADLAPPPLRGSYQGVYQMAWGASAFVGPVLGSLVLGRAGGEALWLGCLLVGVLTAAGHLASGGAQRRRVEALRAVAVEARTAVDPASR
jgi:MFS family permease